MRGFSALCGFGHELTGACARIGNGLQGFQTPIEVDTLIVDGMGALGQTHTERGLTYVEVALSGHMCVRESSGLDAATN